MAKILMVDDDREFLEASKAVLSAEGYQVILTKNVSQAEKKIKEEKPDMIFLDVMMEAPDDGIVFAHKLKKENVGIPIVMLSAIGKVTGYSHNRCDEVMPCDGFLEKPVNPKSLLNKVKKIVGK
ncbi:MAG: response regulator [Candidatus Omnitrophica bacterium]|nr:response regulator [Candidatus Omnitrophota bacterium]MCF7893541.1 response regulator [Candidatus Omnitrophota bacterium]